MAKFWKGRLKTVGGQLIPAFTTMWVGDKNVLICTAEQRRQNRFRLATTTTDIKFLFLH